MSTKNLDSGETLFDGPVICEYLDSLQSGRRMIPEAGDSRWRVLREQALADGILDCAVLIFMETRKRPEPLRWDWWLGLKQRAIVRSLDHLEEGGEALSGRVDLGTVSIAVALGYLYLRSAVGEWRDGRSVLAGWYRQFAQRPSMQATEPPA